MPPDCGIESTTLLRGRGHFLTFTDDDLSKQARDKIAIENNSLKKGVFFGCTRTAVPAGGTLLGVRIQRGEQEPYILLLLDLASICPSSPLPLSCRRKVSLYAVVSKPKH